MDGSRTPVWVRGRAVPPLLLTPIEESRWRHPGQMALARMMPWSEDPLPFSRHAGDGERVDVMGLPHR